MDDLKDLKFIQAKSSFSRAYIYRQIEQGKLSKPIKIGRSSRWRLSDIESWLNAITGGERGLSDLSKANEARLS